MTGQQIAEALTALGVSHVVTVPDSTIGQWQDAIDASGIALVRVCREGEAWAVAAGLYMGGATPLVMIQCTGFFESGDALRNVIHDWKLPLFAIIGYRSYLSQETLPGDTCLTFTEPVLDAWKLDYRLITSDAQIGEMRQHFERGRREGRASVALIAEGKA